MLLIEGHGKLAEDLGANIASVGERRKGNGRVRKFMPAQPHQFLDLDLLDLHFAARASGPADHEGLGSLRELFDERSRKHEGADHVSGIEMGFDFRAAHSQLQQRNAAFALVVEDFRAVGLGQFALLEPQQLGGKIQGNQILREEAQAENAVHLHRARRIFVIPRDGLDIRKSEIPDGDGIELHGVDCLRIPARGIGNTDLSGRFQLQLFHERRIDSRSRLGPGVDPEKKWPLAIHHQLDRRHPAIELHGNFHRQLWPGVGGMGLLRVRGYPQNDSGHD